MNITRKFIAFDLDTNNLKKFMKNYQDAYKQIKNFMIKNGFIHEQGSAYCSINPLTNDEILDIVFDLKDQFEWSITCIKALHVTNIGTQYNLITYIKDNKTNNIEDMPMKQSQSKTLESKKASKKQTKN